MRQAVVREPVRSGGVARRAARAGCAAAVLAALLVPLAGPAPAQEAPTGNATRSTPADFTPLPAADPAAVPSDVAALRDEVLGPAWRDPDSVTLAWTGVSSFALAIGGHVLLLDAWEVIGAVTDYVPVGREELAALEPEAVLVGHGHFDHAGDLGYVAGLSGATVVGSEEHCVVAELGAVREGTGLDFTCLVLGTASTPAAGELQDVELFADLPVLTVMRHVHSAPSDPTVDGEDVDPFVPVMDVQPYLDHLADDPAELQRFLAQQTESNEGGVWLYHLAVGDFTLLWGNSAGPLLDTPEVVEALGALPGCVDVMSNAILGFDQPVSGLQDPVLYVDAARPQVFLPTHADAWAPVISAGQAQYRDELEGRLAELDVPPELDMLLDPQDYVAPRTYDVTDPRWAAAPPGSTCAASAARPGGDGSGDGGGAAPAPDDDARGDAAPTTPGAVVDGSRGGLPATGGGAALAGLAALALVALLRPRRG